MSQHDLIGYTIDDEIACAERELRLRRRVYPRWVEQGKINQDKAEREIDLMKRILKRLAQVRDRGFEIN